MVHPRRNFHAFRFNVESHPKENLAETVKIKKETDEKGDMANRDLLAKTH